MDTALAPEAITNEVRMKRRVLGVLILASTAVFAARTVGAGQAEDVAAIRDVESRQAEAWNRHDAKAYAALFTEDGDVVNPARASSCRSCGGRPASG